MTGKHSYTLESSKSRRAHQYLQPLRRSGGRTGRNSWDRGDGRHRARCRHSGPVKFHRRHIQFLDRTQLERRLQRLKPHQPSPRRQRRPTRRGLQMQRPPRRRTLPPQLLPRRSRVRPPRLHRSRLASPSAAVVARRPVPSDVETPLESSPAGEAATTAPTAATATLDEILPAAEAPASAQPIAASKQSDSVPAELGCYRFRQISVG